MCETSCINKFLFFEQWALYLFLFLAVNGVNRASGLSTSSSSAPAFSIHHDDEENQRPKLPSGNGNWKEPPTQSAATKENESLPGKWTNNDKVTVATFHPFSYL